MSILFDSRVPEYWKEHLEEKIAEINELQQKNSFSFVVMTDMHYPRNVGKITPLLAKEIIKHTEKTTFALCLGDVQTSGCYDTKEEILEENKLIGEMFQPVKDCLLFTEGNHDGSYGWLTEEQREKEPNRWHAYVNNLTPQEIREEFYDRLSSLEEATFDRGGANGYYIDDEVNKVRFIMLNSCCNQYQLLEDGTSEYPKMRIFRFGQEQFDLTIHALGTVPEDDWSVVIGSHCPLDQEFQEDGKLMIALLQAYKNKTEFSGSCVPRYGSVSVNCDFSDSKGELIGYFYGHVHYDGNRVVKNVPYISTTCDVFEDMILPLRKKRIAGTTTEQSFDVVTVDREGHIIHITKIGLGVDRKINY
ncbi:MAG: hypothetical protein E7399_01655 [Ruminococcaceae bacterium]|nr:hypothetical protein [Oscillospiraceae bacterium]